MPKTAKKQTAKTPRGPMPETLRIEGKWEDAVKKSLSKKKGNYILDSLA
jgi:hypothetical protein